MLEKAIEEIINHAKQIDLKVKTPPKISLRNSSIGGELRTEYAAGIHMRLWRQPAAFSTSHHMWCTCEAKNLETLDEFGRIYMFPGNVKFARKGPMSDRNKSNQEIIESSKDYKYISNTFPIFRMGSPPHITGDYPCRSDTLGHFRQSYSIECDAQSFLVLKETFPSSYLQRSKL